MRVATVIASNGFIANELFQVAEYTAGTVSNVSPVGFFEGESLETLFARYKAAINTLNVQHGILFLIESRSSVHQLVASHFSRLYPESKIVTGVNLPMLVSLFISESYEKRPSALADKAEEYGKLAIGVLHDRELISEESETTLSEFDQNPR